MMDLGPSIEEKMWSWTKPFRFVHPPISQPLKAFASDQNSGGDDGGHPELDNMQSMLEESLPDEHV